ncbi:DUF4190 domain-containing protein [Tumebacillus sp. DT12]|uniref:DUF4190 domain-containing protein n=1 Tax=Tumebacillus lacus TaxID=2995335 RepID=A0ABT3X247_9BACL|nr:DUF4190 domain-containing protein [Tumebacillus lacus]MCX7570521.1 DUF4190 domain-containing protein [Tumebacillus lacus]
MAMASLSMGVITLLTSFVPFLNFLSLVMGPFGIVLGFLAIRRIKQSKKPLKGSGVALTGLLLSVAGTALALLILLLLWAAAGQ